MVQNCVLISILFFCGVQELYHCCW